MNQERDVTVGDSSIRYQIKRSRRKTIGLYVFKDQRIEVRVPYFCSYIQADQFVQERHQWISNKLQEFSSVSYTRYENDEDSCFFLGQKIELDVYCAARYSAKLNDGILSLGIKHTQDPAAKQHAISRWYKEQGSTIFAERLETCWTSFADRVSRKPELKLRKMKSRWGSCSRDGDITLNSELIRAPYPLLDYVVTHELSHLLEFNHSPRFYQLMDEAMPDWRERKEQLKQW